MVPGSDQLSQRARQDNAYFKALLNLVPSQSYFSQDQKLAILGVSSEGDEDNEDNKPPAQHRKKLSVNPFTTFTVTEIIEQRLSGAAPGDGKQAALSASSWQTTHEPPSSIQSKQQGKKVSRSSSKRPKTLQKDLQRKETKLEDLQQKLRQKLQELKENRTSMSITEKQEVKQLKRKEKKMKVKQKTGAKIQENKEVCVKKNSSPKKKFPKDKLTPAKIKLDFSLISRNHSSSKSSDLRGRDYKRLLEKVEKRQEKVEKLKEKNKEAGQKLEEKFQWQAAIDKAKGEKVKDDPHLLKKAVKRKEKMKDRRQKKWDDRVKVVEDKKDKRQQKRQANIDNRKNDKKEKVRKKLIKKGRILPGLQ